MQPISVFLDTAKFADEKCWFQQNPKGVSRDLYNF